MEDKKVFSGQKFEFKDSGPQETGEFRAVFATLNVVDKDGDITLPGAFQDGQPVRISSWMHDWDSLPVGKGVIHADQSEAWVDGQFFLDTESGREHYKTIKALGDLVEWSYGFSIEKYSFQNQPTDVPNSEGQVRVLEKLDVIEVSPVMLGAGIGTRTTAIKAALASHSTPTTDAAWDGPANEARVRSGEDAAYYRRIYAWRDPEGDEGVKSSYRFIHHMVSADGEPGAANVRACQTGIGVLNGGRGGTTIPDADRQGVYNHLARHLRDADLEPPELKGMKVGARHSAHDIDDIQAAHDALVRLGAKCQVDNGENASESEDNGKGETESDRKPLSASSRLRKRVDILSIAYLDNKREN